MACRQQRYNRASEEASQWKRVEVVETGPTGESHPGKGGVEVYVSGIRVLELGDDLTERSGGEERGVGMVS